MFGRMLCSKSAPQCASCDATPRLFTAHWTASYTEQKEKRRLRLLAFIREKPESKVFWGFPVGYTERVLVVMVS